ncbi:hypothetical protein PIB30_099339, partial [Stylosanthes scabra]|nr:hypothetical protein [Stylosanthes scabra]
MTVAQAMKPPHGTKVILRLNELGQPIGDAAALVSGVLGVVGKSWKEARNRLWHEYYDSRKTLEQNVLKHPRGVDKDDWRRFLMYRLRTDTK